MSPSRPYRVCSAPGCGALVERGRCAAHEVKQSDRRWKDPEQAAFYRTYRWRRTSELVRAEEPICRECGDALSEVCDHIDGDWRNCARENLRGLCRPCNDRLTAQQHREKGNRGRGGGS